MKKLFLSAAVVIASIAAIVPGGAGVNAAELPTFELTGFPSSPHQISVLGSANVQQQSPAPTLTLGGMPASPVQIAVLTPRSKMTAEITPAKAGGAMNSD